MATANKNLVGVVVRTLEGKLTHIESYGKNGYRLAGEKNQTPMSQLVRVGRRLQVVEEDKVKAIPKGGDQIIDGYLHIYNRDQMRVIKKGEMPDIPVFENWQRVDPKAAPKAVAAKVKAVKPKLTTVKAKAKPKKVSVDKPAVADSEDAPLATAKSKVKAPKQSRKLKSVSKPAPAKSAQAKRSPGALDVTTTLRMVMHHARNNRKQWKEFETIVSASLGVAPEMLPISAREIVEKFGNAKTEKALRALSDHINEVRAEQSLPRVLKQFIKTGEMKLSKQQTAAVVKALAPTVPESLLPVVVNKYFNNSMDFLVKLVEPEATKTKPKSDKGEF